MIKIGKYPSIKLKATNSLFIKFKVFDNSLVSKVKSLPVRYYIPEEKVWEIPLSDIDRLVSLFGIDNIEVVNEISEYTEYIKFLESAKNKKTPEQLKEYYANLKPEVNFNFKTKPRGHQIESFNLALKEPALFITDSMGLGKTMQSLNIMDYKKELGLVNGVLVVCGINGTKYNWVEEINKHSYNNSQVIDGTKKRRLEKIENCSNYFYNIINVESLRDEEILDLLVKKFNDKVLNAVILDECHKMNNHKSKQGSALHKLKCDYKIALTGTPITKRIDKIWNILHWFGIIQESYWSFVKRYCVLGGYTGYDVVGYKNLDELHKKIDKVQLRRTKEILDLPPKIYEPIYVEMNKEQKRQYEIIKEGIIKDLETQETTFVNPAVATIKLRQFTDTLKVEPVKDLVEELLEDDRPVVIFSSYKEPLYRLQKLLSTYNPILITGDISDSEEKQRLVNEFQNNPARKIIMGTIQALGTGFTLTKSHDVIFINKSWIVGENHQAEDRCHRIGTNDTVTIFTVLVKDSVDERVEQILSNDKFYIDRVVDGKIETKISPKDFINTVLS